MGYCVIDFNLGKHNYVIFLFITGIVILKIHNVVYIAQTHNENVKSAHLLFFYLKEKGLRQLIITISTPELHVAGGYVDMECPGSQGRPTLPD